VNHKLAVKKFNDLQTDPAAKLSDLAQAIRFSKSLCDSMHGEIKWLLQVELDSGSPSFPKTAQAVFQRVVNHTPRFTTTIKGESASTVMSARRTGKPPRSQKSDKYCSFHKCKGHSDAECNAQKKPSSSASSSVPPSTSAPRASSGPPSRPQSSRHSSSRPPRNHNTPPARQHAAVVVPDDEEELLETYNGLMALTNRHSPSEVILDNGAEISIFKDANLLSNITECKPIKVKGVNSSDKCLIVRQQGLFQNAIQVYFSKDASANIISYCQLDDALGIVWDAPNHRFNTRDEQFVFARNGNLFILTQDPSKRCFTSLNQTKPAVRTRELVRDIQKKLGFPSELTLAQAIRSGSISNIPVTVKDVENTLALEGRHIATLQGKAQTARSPHLSITTVPQLSNKRVTLFVDIMFIEKEPYLLSVGEPMGVTLINLLASDPTTRPGSRSAENLKANVFAQVSRYSTFAFGQ
jgi:hypothetical protein